MPLTPSGDSDSRGGDLHGAGHAASDERHLRGGAKVIGRLVHLRCDFLDLLDLRVARGDGTISESIIIISAAMRPKSTPTFSDMVPTAEMARP